MTVGLLSPRGSTNRRDYLSIFLVCFFGTIFTFMVASDLRSHIPFDFFYLAVSVVTTALAWLQLCATIRRLQNLSWPWLLALPWIPVSFWPIVALFGIPISGVVAWTMVGYCILTLGPFVFRQPIRNVVSQGDQPAAGRLAPPINAESYVAPLPVSLPVPLLGWLVALDGTGRGTEFRLRPPPTAASSNTSNSIRAVDGQGGPADHASICYAPGTNSYSIAPASGTLQLNGHPVSEASPLAAYDRVQIQQASFIFVPLYGWADRPSERKF